MGRAALGVFRSTPLGVVAAESKLTPAGTLLEHRQTRFAQRLLARPEDGGSMEEILGRRSSLTSQLRAAAGLRAGETVERQESGKMRTFQGRYV